MPVPITPRALARQSSADLRLPTFHDTGAEQARIPTGSFVSQPRRTPPSNSDRVLLMFSRESRGDRPRHGPCRRARPGDTTMSATRRIGAGHDKGLVYGLSLLIPMLFAAGCAPTDAGELGSDGETVGKGKEHAALAPESVYTAD